MPMVLLKYTFTLPYHINMVEGEVTKNIEIPLEKNNKITLYPPTASKKERFVNYRSPEVTIWSANQIDIDVQIEVEAPSSFRELNKKFAPIAEKYLRLFLRYCRSETEQYQIDLRESHYPTHAVYIDQNGKQDRYGIMLTTMEIGEEPCLNNRAWQSMSKDILGQTRIPFWTEALLDAKLYRLSGDYRMSVLSSAMGIEHVIHAYLRKKLVSLENISQKQIDKFLAEVSNRLLVTVGFGIFSSIDSNILENCSEILDLRNNILHNQKRTIHLDEATKSINNLEALILAKDVNDILGD